MSLDESDSWITDDDDDDEVADDANGIAAAGGALMGSTDSVTAGGSSCCSSPTPRNSPKRSPMLQNVSIQVGALDTIPPNI